jgi:hypothetical protein
LPSQPGVLGLNLISFNAEGVTCRHYLFPRKQNKVNAQKMNEKGIKQEPPTFLLSY